MAADGARRRNLSGPVLAIGWVVLCAVVIFAKLGSASIGALPWPSQALLALLVLGPALLLWGGVILRQRAGEFASVSSRLSEQLDRLYSPSEDRDRRAQEALLALRRQAEDLAGAVDTTVKRIEATADSLGTRLTDSMSAVNSAMERAEWARSDLEAATGPLNRLVETLASESAAIKNAVGRDLDAVSERLAEHVEDVEKAVDRALATRHPLIIVSASGGARMMEGIVSLMQLAKISAGLARLDDARVPYISIMTDPTTGGVTASFAMLGDLNIAEPGALIGFAGPRVIEQTTRQKLPEGFQRSEFLMEHGFLDAIVQRKDMKSYLAETLDWMSPAVEVIATEIPTAESLAS